MNTDQIKKVAQVLRNYRLKFRGKSGSHWSGISSSSHDFEEIAENDISRQERLESLGVRFLRFSDLQVKKDMVDVLLAIQYWIEDHEEKR